MKRLLLMLGAAALLVFAPIAQGMIGQTPDQVIQGARRDKDTVSIEAEPYGNRSALQVYYRDGATINHVFGTNGREIAFFLTAVKRLTNEEVFAMQRMYHTQWRGTGIFNGISSYESRSNLYMGVSRDKAFDFVTILDQSRMDEIGSATIVASTTPAPAPVPVYPPPQQPYAPAPAPEESPNDCLIEATKAYAQLKTTAAWVRIAGLNLTRNGQSVAGHAVVFFQPTEGSNVWMYDKSGSYDLGTQSHDLQQLTNALYRSWKLGPYEIRSVRWIEG